MKPFERSLHGVPFRAGIAVAAMAVLALSSAAARRAEPAMQAAAPAGGVQRPRGCGKQRHRPIINRH